MLGRWCFQPVQPPISSATEVSGRCVLSVGGATRCFSMNTPAPVDARDDPQPTRARGLALGANHSCAERISGELACWGENGSGQLSDDSITDRPSPVTVLKDHHAIFGTSLAAGALHGVHPYGERRAQCWGDNASGQTGDPILGGIRELITVNDQGTTPLSNVVAVTNGDESFMRAAGQRTGEVLGLERRRPAGRRHPTTPASPANYGLREGVVHDESWRTSSPSSPVAGTRARCSSAAAHAAGVRTTPDRRRGNRATTSSRPRHRRREWADARDRGRRAPHVFHSSRWRRAVLGPGTRQASSVPSSGDNIP